MKSYSPTFRIAAVVLLAGVLPALAAWAAYAWIGGTAFVEEPLHQAFELVGSSIGIAVALLLLLRVRHEQAPRHLMWVAGALVAMGLADAVHGVLPFGTSFSWTRHGATFIGGLVFAMVWLPPPRLAVARPRVFLLLVAVAAATASAALSAWSYLLPEAFLPVGYSDPVKLANVLGGAGFVAASVFFLRHYHSAPQHEALMLASLTLLFGTAGLLFGFSHVWAADWWVWHAFRLLAYVVVLASGADVVVSLYRRLAAHARELESTNTALQEEMAERRRAEATIKMERQRLFDVLETLPAMISLVRPDREVAFANRALRERFGEVRGRHCYEYCYGRTERCAFCQSDVVLETGRPHRWEVEGSGGSVLAVYDSPFTDIDGSPMILKMDLDITEQRRAEAALGDLNETLERRVADRTDLLRQSEARTRLFIEHAPAALAMFDRDMRYLSVSQRWLADYGLEGQDLRGRSHYDVFPEIPERWRESHRRGLAGEVLREEEDRFDRADGSVQWLRWEIRPWEDAAGQVAGIVVFSEDITHRKRTEEALRDANLRLEAADRQKDEFIAVLSHELRNPLAAIRYALPVVQRADLGDQGGQAATVIGRQLDHLTRLVNDLLDVSRITRGKLELQRETLVLQSVLKEAVEAASSVLVSAGHTLDVDLPEQPIWSHIDRARLVQVVVNLLDNSAKFTPAGGSIALDLEVADRRAVIRLRDTGVGIPSDAVSRVFEMFRQESQRDRGQAGLGIGLALVKRLVEMHGGTIEARSAGAGQGAEFIVRLPTAAAPAAEARVPAAEAGSGGTLKVLIVDDNVDFVQMLSMVVAGQGHDVRTAHDGGSAVAAARAYQPDVVLLDLGLPVMTGIEVARELRARPETAGACLVALTGWGQAEDRARTREAGFDFHLTKPTEPADLEQLLDEIGRRSPAEDARPARQ